MAYCTKCGAQVEGKYCVRCGTAVGRGQVVPFGRPAAGGGARLEGNQASALCYLFGFVSGIIFLLVAPYRGESQVRFHAFQSILLSATVMLLHIVVTVVALALSVVSLSLGVLVSSLHVVVNLGFFAVWLYLMWKSYQGQRVLLPVLGEMAGRLAGSEEPGAPAGTVGPMGKAA
jgi:uncharacterized membrane protein